MSGKGYSGGCPRTVVARPRWLADEMVGRLARYLRFVGCDTAYARGWTDDEILARAREENRVILTRDRRLASRARNALLLESPFLPDQWKAVRAAYPEVPTEVRFERCTECNGELVSVREIPSDRTDPAVPWDRVAGGLPLFRCAECHHYYWEGSHTADIRARLADWAQGRPP